MPATRLTLASNASQTTRTVLLLQPTVDAYNFLLTSAKSKLRLKKPTRIFLTGGRELRTSKEIRDVLNDGLVVLISSGEDYVGNVASSSSDPADPSTAKGGDVRLIAEKIAIDPLAVQQLEACALLPGIDHAVGLPDLHPGTKFPIGCTFVSRSYIHPPLIGGDIGCGMSWYRTSLKAEKLADASAVRKIGENLRGLEGEWMGSLERKLWLGGDEASNSEGWTAGEEWDKSLGTIGAGNHFAEVQVVESVKPYDYPDLEGMKSANIYTPPFTEGEVILLVHSGSRGYGQHVLSQFYNPSSPDETGNSVSLHESDPRTALYLSLHDRACEWASRSRDLIAVRFLEKLEGSSDWTLPSTSSDPKTHIAVLRQMLETRKVMSIHHNNVTATQWPPSAPPGDQKTVYIHRKGAAPSTPSIPLVPLPGSRGTPTLFLHPLFTAETGYGFKNALSLAHGAGRLMSRAKANASLSRKYNGDVEVLTNMKKTSTTTSSKAKGAKKKAAKSGDDFYASGGGSGSGSGGGKIKTKESEIPAAGWVICDDKDLVWEEAPEAYKDVEIVGADLEAMGVAVLCGRVRPRVTYKIRKGE